LSFFCESEKSIETAGENGKHIKINNNSEERNKISAFAETD